MNQTKIEWVKNPDGSQGYTWNPITGCLNHTNGLCKGGGFPCYAYKLANGRLEQRYLANKNIACGFDRDPRYISENNRCWHDPFYPRFWEERLYHSWTGKPKGIFICDMGELFGDWIPREWQEKIINLIRSHRENRYYLLTKQPQNLIKWSPFPDNCFVGVTATDTFRIGEALGYLSRIEAQIKYLSLEPLLDRILYVDAGLLSIVNWLIIGAQTKPYKPPDISSIRAIVEATDKAGVKVFLKDNLRPLLIPEDCSKPNYLTEDMFWASEKAQLRQELPKE